MADQVWPLAGLRIQTATSYQGPAAPDPALLNRLRAMPDLDGFIDFPPGDFRIHRCDKGRRCLPYAPSFAIRYPIGIVWILTALPVRSAKGPSRRRGKDPAADPLGAKPSLRFIL